MTRTCHYQHDGPRPAVPHRVAFRGWRGLVRWALAYSGSGSGRHVYPAIPSYSITSSLPASHRLSAPRGCVWCAVCVCVCVETPRCTAEHNIVNITRPIPALALLAQY